GCKEKFVMQKRILTVLITFLVVMPLIAQEQRRPQTFTERYGEQLGLTDTQKTVINDLEKKFDEDHASFLAEYHQTMRDYREARQANDSARLDALKPKMESQRAEMMKLRG